MNPSQTQQTETLPERHMQMDFMLPSRDKHTEGVVFGCTSFGLLIGVLCAQGQTIFLVAV